MLAGELQHARVFFLRFAPPFFESRHVDHVSRDHCIVERKHIIVVNQHILPTRLGFDIFNIIDQLLVESDKFTRRIDFVCNQSLTNEYLARLKRIDRAVMHATAGIDDQSVDRHLLERHYLPGFTFPVRLEVRARDQVCGELLEPLWLN